MSIGVVYLWFSGLIVFVPSPDKDSLTAYIVDDMHDPKCSCPCDHVPTLSIFGNVSIASGSLCNSKPDGSISCDLSSDMVVKLDTVKNSVALPSHPAGDLPHDDSMTNGGSGGWLVQMKEIESAAAAPKSPPELGAMSAAQIEFGWFSAYTCAFDQGGKAKMVQTMEFSDPYGDVASPHQAVAEAVMFETKARISNNLAKLTIARGADSTEIVMNCDGGVCALLRVSNNVRGECHGLDHFLHFYRFSSNEATVKQRSPRRIAGHGMPEDKVTFDCSTVLKQFNGSELVKKLNVAFGRSAEKASDILICPPVLMGQ